MQPSRRTFLKTAAASAGALWAYPTQAQAKYEVRVHFVGLFVGLKDENGVPIIASLNDLKATHRIYLAVHPDNYKSGTIGTEVCKNAKVVGFKLSKGKLEGPAAVETVKPTFPKATGKCPANLAEWRDPRWHIKVAAMTSVVKRKWHAEAAVDLMMRVESDAIEAEPPLIETARTLMWKVGDTTQALTDRLLYIVKTNDLKFLFKNKTLELKTNGTAVDVYVLTIPKDPISEIPYKKGDELSHFKLGHSLLISGKHTPIAAEPCEDFAKSVVESPVVEALYDCLSSSLLSKTVFCPGYSNFP